MKMSEKALAGAVKLKMNEQQVLAFLTGADAEKNALCQAEDGHIYCHRQIGCVTVWMEYHDENEELFVDSIYHHRVVIHE